MFRAYDIMRCFLIWHSPLDIRTDPSRSYAWHGPPRCHQSPACYSCVLWLPVVDTRVRHRMYGRGQETIRHASI